MNTIDPKWSITDDALSLILHAQSGLIKAGYAANQDAILMQVGKLGGEMASALVRRETAVLRLISTVEAYANAASEFFFFSQGLPAPKMPFTWPARIRHYANEHSIDLEACDSWKQVKAGIDLRNCLAHGLGNLTDLLTADQALGSQMKHIDVNIGGNRMHTTNATVPKLSQGCRQFVLWLEEQLVSQI
ncbi:hypothetical protein [Lentzea sp. NEAU-D7]|uniref:hypothetical protein n=1 Tax=Lentzea sp. NEAU-D7 TaxID=2994667 RepID=UPI00224B7763|nr:hypothetical protein [Lentzea sp. NEAU-D7]MCX2954471.1 hypothetical protein [Lentzea sp. NEAU-D7]